MRKNIVISQRNLRHTTSGTPRKVHEETRYLSERGHRVYVLAERIDAHAVRESGGIPVKTRRWPIRNYTRRTYYDRQVRRFAEKNKPDLVIGHGDIIHQDILFIHNCVHLAHELVHGKPMDPKYPRGRIHHEILTRRQFRLLVCNSHLARQDLTRRFSIPDDCATVLYPEYNDRIFGPDDHESHRRRFRRQYHLEDDLFVIGLVTSGDFQKRNAELLIRAFHALRKQYPLRLLLVGENYPEPAATLVRQLGLDDTVIFAPCTDTVQIYYHGIDLFVLPALIEEFGRTVLEVMACGVPVIVGGRVGAAEILEGSSRDCILEDSSMETLCGKIVRLYENPSLRRELSELNHQTATRYCASAQAERFGAIVEPFLNAHPPPAETNVPPGQIDAIRS